MSEEEKSKEEEIDVERAVSFFRALQEYFKQNPNTLTSVLHSISENLIDAINTNGELRKDIGFAVGQLEVVVDLLWSHDDKEIIQHALTSSPNLEDIMDVIARLAFTYNRLMSSTEIIPGEIEGIVKDTTTTLYRIIEYIISDADGDP
jgi:hypothetical protein